MIKYLYNWWYRKFPPEMVSWWMRQDACRAKVTEASDGSFVMWMESEKYPFPGYPRGHLLYGSLSPLKHQIKNQIFNDAHALLEEKSPEEVSAYIIDEVLPKILKLGHDVRHDMMPFHRMTPVVKEIHRAMTEVGFDPGLRDILCFIFQEDDAYRFRFQWLARWMKPKDPTKSFNKGMGLMEHAEVVGDMKDRVRLVKEILLMLTADERFKSKFEAFSKELNWKKVRLSKGDKYYFRAKYFKVDYPDYEY